MRKACIDKLVPYRRRSIDITNEAVTARELLRRQMYTPEDDERQGDFGAEFVIDTGATIITTAEPVEEPKLKRVRTAVVKK